MWITKSKIDLYEINEAFAVVSYALNQIQGLEGGGAMVLGHIIGASDDRGILITLF